MTDHHAISHAMLELMLRRLDAQGRPDLTDVTCVLQMLVPMSVALFVDPDQVIPACDMLAGHVRQFAGMLAESMIDDGGFV